MGQHGKARGCPGLGGGTWLEASSIGAPGPCYGCVGQDATLERPALAPWQGDI